MRSPSFDKLGTRARCGQGEAGVRLPQLVTRSMRIALVNATRQALANGLNLLAVEAPEAM